MRDILFRGKRRNHGEWIYGDLVTKQNICIANDWHEVIRVDDETVGQFTGLTDKNGKQIFEGDIVKLTDKNNNYEWTAVVEFGNPNSYYSWGWQLKPITKNVEYNLDILCWVDIDEFGIFCEVIGNIYDNPELLGGAE